MTYTHDPLCPVRRPLRPSCECDFIAEIRADERRKVNNERVARFGYWHDYDPLEGGH